MANTADQLKNKSAAELVKYLSVQHGITVRLEEHTQATLLARIKELEGDSTPVAPGSLSSNGELPTHVVIEIAEDADSQNYVQVIFNGRNFQIKKGTPVKVPYGVYEILNNAVEEVFTTVKNEQGRSTLLGRKRHRHPFSVSDKIYAPKETKQKSPKKSTKSKNATVNAKADAANTNKSSADVKDTGANDGEGLD